MEVDGLYRKTDFDDSGTYSNLGFEIEKVSTLSKLKVVGNLN